MWFTLKRQKSKKDTEFDKYGNLSNSNGVSYTSPLIQKLHPCGGVTSKTYKPTFYGSYLSRNTSYCGAATSGYSVFHSGNTLIQLGLPWQSYSCQYLNTETSTWGNRGFTTETLSISYTISLYIRLVVTL